MTGNEMCNTGRTPNPSHHRTPASTFLVHELFAGLSELDRSEN